MESKAVVVPLLNKGDKVVYGVGSDFRIKLSLYGSAALHGNGYNWIGHKYLPPWD